MDCLIDNASTDSRRRVARMSSSQVRDSSFPCPPLLRLRLVLPLASSHALHMTKPKRYQRYSAEFKREAIRRAAVEGITDKKVCDELGISTRQFRHWRRREYIFHYSGPAKTLRG